jgi:hypothetical protein
MIVDIAKSVRLVEDEIARRGIKLIGRGPERCGPCPRCGGRDRFSIHAGKQVFNCRGCGVGGDVIALVQHLDACGFGDAVKMLGGTERKPTATVKPAVVQDTKEDEAKRIALAMSIWDDASPIEGVPLGEAYLERRGLLNDDLPGEDVLRFSRCTFGNSNYPCILALYRDIVTNEPKAISRTAIGPNGIKIGRKALGPVMGCAVKLDPNENVELGLHAGEGVETMLAARLKGFRPAWALGSAGAIRNFPVLAGIESLTVIVDNDLPDKNGRQAGQEAAKACSDRWVRAGREVLRVVPRRPGADLADVVGGRHHVA